MTSSPAVNIEASYDGNQPLVSILESNLDLEQVSIRRSEYAVKAVIPLSIVIATSSLYLLEKLVLDPLVEPIAEKFNWVTAVKKYLTPFQSFNLTVQINDGDFIEASIDDQEVISQVWNIIRKTLSIVKTENRLEETSKIRFISSQRDELLIVCYKNNRPARIVELASGKTREIPKEQAEEINKPPTMEDFVESVTKRAEAYRKYIEDQKKTSGE
jgi:hypothetical protein